PASAATQNVPTPLAAWSFEKDASDAFGNLNGTLEGGAEIRDGRLILDGQGSYLRTEALPFTLRAKTLEAWVAPTTLDHRGGGIITVESTAEHSFDSIVFAEKEPRHWVAGSNFFKRSENAGGPAENAKPGELIHIAVVYGEDDRVALYRNGEPYGHSYSKAPLYPFEQGKARVLLGLRHKGAGSGFFAGEIEEARLYGRALTAEEVAASFRAGAVPVVTPEQVAAALTPEQRAQRDTLSAEIEKLRAESAAADPGAEAWEDALADAAKNSTNPLHLWAKLGATNDADFSAAWSKLAEPLRASIEEARKTNRESFKQAWDLAGADYAKWFPYGSGLSREPLAAGEFSIESNGERVLDGIYPGGAMTHRLSEKHNGLLTSPRFKIETDNISVRAFGSGGAMVRVIVDNYPLPSNPIFPKANLNSAEPSWVRIDTAYRKGSWAYVEFATREDLTRPLGEVKDKQKPKGAPPPGASHFGAGQVVFHDGKEPPADENGALAALLDGAAPASARELASHYGRVIAGAVAAWRNSVEGGVPATPEREAAHSGVAGAPPSSFTEPQRALLDSLVRRDLLPAMLAELEAARPLVEEYRQLEAQVPELRHAPGVLETAAYDAPFLPRGDHLKPGEAVPRAYLEVLGGQPFRTQLSGRHELADAIANPQNPLTARVMVNRIWHWLFGRGIVPTVDNFGRLGERPTHREMLDFLAASFIEPRSGAPSSQLSTLNSQPAFGWSIKETIRFLVTTRAFQMSSEPSELARESDPANDWLSHMRVRRLEAEAIRD
ncbi:MAG TPA: DUF1553 domain-containing protein, partial [Chthoniobacteraceae bacterium]|nr:DUF1553 domain-containing protein [Chthoniobacteraceae bacterium]